MIANQPTQTAVPVLLVLGGVLSVQFGGALAATLVPVIGAGGSVLLRIMPAALIMIVISRPRLGGRTRSDWLAVALFGLSLAGMNFAFYSSLAYLPIGVAVTIEFIGPLGLAMFTSRRLIDFLAVAAAAIGVIFISGLVGHSQEQIPLAGFGWAFLAGLIWAGYIITAQRIGKSFARLDGLSLALVVAAALSVPVGLAQAPHFTTPQILTGLGVAILSSVLPYSLDLLALRHLAQRTFGILLSLEPAVAALAGMIVLGQILSPSQLLGMVLVGIASITVLTAGAKSGV